jgi:hypothetical protein
VVAAEAAAARPGASVAGANLKSLVDAGYRAGSC